MPPVAHFDFGTGINVPQAKEQPPQIDKGKGKEKEVADDELIPDTDVDRQSLSIQAAELKAAELKALRKVIYEDEDGLPL